MEIQLRAHRFSADQKLADFITKKLEKLTTFYDQIINAEVSLKLESQQKVKDKVADVKVNIPGKTLFAAEVSKSFEESIDLATESLRRQLIRAKQKQMK